MTPYLLVVQMKKVLRNAQGWLAKAAANAEAKKYDSAVLVQSRIAPDMFPFARQVQAMCDVAKLSASRLAGKEAPSNPDTETTLAELGARIESTIAYLESFTEADFAGVADRKVTQPRWDGKYMTATDYFVQHAIPNFFFHATTSYALLRHAGVDVGKRDFLGTMTYMA